MIEEILPPSAIAVDTRRDRLDIELFPQELAALGRAVEKRRREFVTARACVREALGRLGLPPAPIVGGDRGQPLWPAGVLGSITHCAGYRGCALARAGGELAGLGIDAEPDEPLPDGVLEAVARPEERLALARLSREVPELRWDRLLFSAKESVYKVWFPLAGSWLGFEDATLTFDVGARAFTAALHKPWPQAGPAPGASAASSGAVLPRALDGRWLVRDGLVLTAIALPAG